MRNPEDTHDDFCSFKWALQAGADPSVTKGGQSPHPTKQVFKNFKNIPLNLYCLHIAHQEF